VGMKSSCIIIVLILIAYPNNTLSQIRHVNPPNILPPPRPTKPLWSEASFYKWESKDIIKAFKDKTLEVEDVKPGYTLNPTTPREGTIFLKPSFGKNIGGYVSSYNSKDDFNNAKNYYLQMNKNPESPAWWIFEKDNILVLISGKVPEEKAREYERVLNEIDKK
jgi:hypothetical protein